MRSRFRAAAAQVLLAAILLFGTATAVFVVYEASPEDVAIRVLGPYSPYEQRDLWLETNGYFDSALERFPRWLGWQVRGDFGESIRFKMPVAEVLWPRVSASLRLVGWTLLFLLPGAFLLAALAARHPGGPADRLLRGLALMTSAIPDFVVALLLVVLLFQAHDLIGPVAGGFLSITWPVLTLLLAHLGRLAIRLRSALVQRLPVSHFGPVLLTHALLAAGWLLGSLLPVEYFFGYKGLGTLLLESFLNQDQYLVEACLIVAVMLGLLVKLPVNLLSLLTASSVPSHQAPRSTTSTGILGTWAARIGLVLLGIWLLLALSASWLAPFPPNATLLPLAGPGTLYEGSDSTAGGFLWLGADHIGRDLLSRVLWAANTTLVSALAATLLAALLGMVLGLGIARLEPVFGLSRLPSPSGALGLPMLGLCLLAMIHFRLFQSSMIVLPALASVPAIALAMAQARASQDLPWARALLAEAARRFGAILALLTFLGFVGFWPPPPEVSWGSMIMETRQMVMAFPSMALSPPVALFTAILGARLLVRAWGPMQG